MNGYVVELIFAFMAIAIATVEIYEYNNRKWGENR